MAHSFPFTVHQTQSRHNYHLPRIQSDRGPILDITRPYGCIQPARTRATRPISRAGTSVRPNDRTRRTKCRPQSVNDTSVTDINQSVTADIRPVTAHDSLVTDINQSVTADIWSVTAHDSPVTDINQSVTANIWSVTAHDSPVTDINQSVTADIWPGSAPHVGADLCVSPNGAGAGALCCSRANTKVRPYASPYTSMIFF